MAFLKWLYQVLDQLLLCVNALLRCYTMLGYLFHSNFIFSACLQTNPGSGSEVFDTVSQLSMSKDVGTKLRSALLSFIYNELQ